MDCAGCLVAVAQHVMKMARKLGLGIGTLGPEALADVIAVIAGRAADDTVVDFAAPTWRFVWVSWWTLCLKPALRYIYCRFDDFLNSPPIVANQPKPRRSNYGMAKHH